MTEQKTMKVHRYAECSEAEADHDGAYGSLGRIARTNAIKYVEDVVFTTPVRYLGCVDAPVPLAPRTVERVSFTPVDVPEADAEGRWWYQHSSESVSYWTDVADPAKRLSHYLRRTVETITIEPEVWRCRARIKKLFGVFFAVVFWIPDADLMGKEFPTREQAEADLPLLKRLAEDYAAAHGAVIEWEAGK